MVAYKREKTFIGTIFPLNWKSGDLDVTELTLNRGFVRKKAIIYFQSVNINIISGSVYIDKLSFEMFVCLTKYYKF